MELELKAKEYKSLCKHLDKLKESNIDPNDESLLELKENFIKNQEEIVEINKQIKELKENTITEEKIKMEQYDYANLFKKNKMYNIEQPNEDKKILVVEKKKNILIKIIEKIKKILNK